MTSTAAFPPLTLGSRPVLLTDEQFEEALLRCRPRVRRIVGAMVRDDHVAENVVQECFLRAFRHRSGWRGESSFETWLVSIALNVVRDESRSRRFTFWRGMTTLGDASGQAAGRETRDPRATPEDELAARQEVEALRRALLELPEGQREVFVLRFVEEMSLAEIAETLGVTVGTVKTQLHRATGAVRSRVRRTR